MPHAVPFALALACYVLAFIAIAAGLFTLGQPAHRTQLARRITKLAFGGVGLTAFASAITFLIALPA